MIETIYCLNNPEEIKLITQIIIKNKNQVYQYKENLHFFAPKIPTIYNKLNNQNINSTLTLNEYNNISSALDKLQTYSIKKNHYPYKRLFDNFFNLLNNKIQPTKKINEQLNIINNWSNNIEKNYQIISQKI